MALNTNKSGSYSDHIDSYLESRFLDRLVKTLHVVKFGKKKSLPAHGGNTIKWNRFTNFAADVTELSEAITPDGQSLASGAVSATVKQYGNYVTVSDWFQLNAINDTLLDATDLLAYQAALSLDSIARNELDVNGTQNYANGVANKAAVESGTVNIASADLRKIQKAFQVADVPSVGGSFKGILHPLMAFDLLSETATNSFVILAANTSNTAQEKGAIGNAYGIDLMLSTNVRADETETNTFGNIFLGGDAFGVVDIASAGLEIIRKPFGTAGTEDPLNQRATVGYKVSFVAKVLEAPRVQVLWAYNAG